MTPSILLIEAAVGAVWIYEGLWCKVLGRAPQQIGIVQAVPVFSSKTAQTFLVALGYAETALGGWALSGWLPTECALVQTAVLLSMNSVGLLFARNQIHDPAGMVLKNIVLAVLAWVPAGLGRP